MPDIETNVTISWPIWPDIRDFAVLDNARIDVEKKPRRRNGMWR